MPEIIIARRTAQYRDSHEVLAHKSIAERGRSTGLSVAGWSTDEDLAAAVKEFAAKVPGYVMPAAYGVARVEDRGLTFGEVNDFGHTRSLPAVVLAAVCGYSAATVTYKLSVEQFGEAVALLAPADAAVHMDHPNLWSWQGLLEESKPASTFLAFFVADPGDQPVDDFEIAFRNHLSH